MSKDKAGNTFDLGLFKRLMRYTRPYRLTFIGVAFAAISLSVFSSVRPILLKYTIDDYNKFKKIPKYNLIIDFSFLTSV